MSCRQNTHEQWCYPNTLFSYKLNNICLHLLSKAVSQRRCCFTMSRVHIDWAPSLVKHCKVHHMSYCSGPCTSSERVRSRLGRRPAPPTDIVFNWPAFIVNSARQHTSVLADSI